MTLQGKTVLLGVTGSIAAYKSAALASMLVKSGASVHVLMTKNAAQFINPITFETLTAHKCILDTFDRGFEFTVEHVSLAKQADLALIAPATANVIGKLASGIADDMLTTTVLAVTAPKLVAPAMNTAMYENPIVQDNLRKLASYGYEILEPASGLLACKDVGKGRMPEPEALFAHIERHLACEKDLAGRRVLVTAGPTQEAVDPIRFLTNHSSGKMGYALAKAAMLRGADVTLVSGPVAIEVPPFVEVVHVTSAAEMASEVIARFPQTDIVIKAAAVADFTPVSAAEQKIKKGADALTLELKKTEDILAWLGTHKRPEQFVCGFAMETENLLERAGEKLTKKKADMICANSLREEGAGFAGDTNVITIVTEDGEESLSVMSKEECAHRILDAIARRMPLR